MIIEAGAAVVIVVTTHSPFGEAERTASRWLPYLRLGTALALTGVAIGVLQLAVTGASLDGGVLVLARNVIGVTGIGLLTLAGHRRPAGLDPPAGLHRLRRVRADRGLAQPVDLAGPPPGRPRRLDLRVRWSSRPAWSRSPSAAPAPAWPTTAEEVLGQQTAGDGEDGRRQGDGQPQDRGRQGHPEGGYAEAEDGDGEAQVAAEEHPGQALAAGSRRMRDHRGHGAAERAPAPAPATMPPSRNRQKLASQAAAVTVAAPRHRHQSPADLRRRAALRAGSAPRRRGEHIDATSPASAWDGLCSVPASRRRERREQPTARTAGGARRGK